VSPPGHAGGARAAGLPARPRGPGDGRIRAGDHVRFRNTLRELQGILRQADESRGAWVRGEPLHRRLLLLTIVALVAFAGSEISVASTNPAGPWEGMSELRLDLATGEVTHCASDCHGTDASTAASAAR
jgi:hypothetical protein